MRKDDLLQISNLLDEKLGENNKEVFFVMDKKFKENNKKIFEKIDGVSGKIDGVKKLLKKEFNWLGKSTKKGFDEVDKGFNKVDKGFNKVDKGFDRIDKTLDKKADKSTLLNWADNRILELALDRDKVKYLHVKEWKKLPSIREINNVLIKEKLR